MSLPLEDLAAAGRAIVGYDLTPPTMTRRVRPPAHLMSRLLQLHEAAGRLAATVPDLLMSDAVSKVIAQELTAVFVKCMTADAGSDERRYRGGSGMQTMRRFEELLEAN